MHFFRLRLVAALLLGITLISAASTYFDVLAHRHTMRGELVRRTQWYGAGLEPQLEEQLNAGGTTDWTRMLKRFRRQPDQPNLALLDANGGLLAWDGDASLSSKLPRSLLERALNTGKETGAFVRIADGSETDPTLWSKITMAGQQTGLWYEDALPLRSQGKTAGVVLMLADANYISMEGAAVWQRSFLRIAAMVVLISVITVLMVHWLLKRPVARAAEWLQQLRRGEADVSDGAKEFGYLVPLAREVTSLTDSLNQARAAAQTEAWLRDQAERVWTADRLAANARELLGNGRLFVLSNREPYMHVRQGGQTECVVPPSGLVTALEPVLRACDGTWIAQGSGSEDAKFVDEHDRLRVPPQEARYTLRRVWLSEEEEAGFYEGFSNEGLWPLCHIAHTRPIFRTSDWKIYQSVNRKFAEAVLEEMRGARNPVVLVQDYHFALVPRMVKEARPDARVAMFWHIPWPTSQAFGICPWQAELLDGLVGADVMGFHLQSFCNNFLDTVDRVLESRTDWEHFSIRRNGHLCSVRANPISVSWDEHDSKPAPDQAATAPARGGETRLQIVASSRPETEPSEMGSDGDWGTGTSLLHREMGIEGKRLLLGVDRMDYTKGIVERLLAIENLLEQCPWYLEQIVFAQIAAPSRTRIPSYAALRVQVEETADRINRRFQTSRWNPVILIERNCKRNEVLRYYRAADVCLVTSLHDGMNLVAKEYAAARPDCDGVLVLSRFAGAAEELNDAVLVNPYDIEQVGDAIRTALEMSRGERRLRMERIRHQVKEHNVYRWASNVLTDLCAVRVEDEMLSATMNRPRQRLG